MSERRILGGIPHILSKDGNFWEVDKTSEEYKQYRAGADKQLEQWMLGNPTHNNWHEKSEYGECCPDFSCCGGDLWEKELREKFVAGDQGTRTKMLMMSFGRMVKEQTPEVKTYLSGETSTTIH